MRKVHFAALAISVAAVTPALAIDPVFDNPSDLILGAISAGATSNVEINLGSPTQFKNAFTTGTNLFLGNIGTQLSATFGATWYDNVGTDVLLFGVVGASSNGSLSAGTANINGDFNSTAYATRSRAVGGTIGQANSTPWSITAGNVTTAASSMLAQANTFAANNSAGILTISNSASNDWSDFNPTPTGTPAYSTLIGTDGVSFRLNSGAYGDGTFGSLTGVEGVVDLYRLARFTNGGLVGGGTITPGLGQYIGSIAIQQNGDVNYVVAAVPEPSTALFGGLTVLGMALRRRRTATCA